MKRVCSSPYDVTIQYNTSLQQDDRPGFCGLVIEIWEQIFMISQLREVTSLRLTCKFLYHTCGDNIRLAKRLFPEAYDESKSQTFDETFKDLLQMAGKVRNCVYSRKIFLFDEPIMQTFKYGRITNIFQWKDTIVTCLPYDDHVDFILWKVPLCTLGLSNPRTIRTTDISASMILNKGKIYWFSLNKIKAMDIESENPEETVIHDLGGNKRACKHLAIHNGKLSFTYSTEDDNKSGTIGLFIFDLLTKQYTDDILLRTKKEDFPNIDRQWVIDDKFFYIDSDGIKRIDRATNEKVSFNFQQRRFEYQVASVIIVDGKIILGLNNGEVGIVGMKQEPKSESCPLKDFGAGMVTKLVDLVEGIDLEIVKFKQIGNIGLHIGNSGFEFYKVSNNLLIFKISFKLSFVNLDTCEQVFYGDIKSLSNRDIVRWNPQEGKLLIFSSKKIEMMLLNFKADFNTILMEIKGHFLSLRSPFEGLLRFDRLPSDLKEKIYPQSKGSWLQRPPQLAEAISVYLDTLKNASSE